MKKSLTIVLISLLFLSIVVTNFILAPDYSGTNNTINTNSTSLINSTSSTNNTNATATNNSSTNIPIYNYSPPSFPPQMTSNPSISPPNFAVFNKNRIFVLSNELICRINFNIGVINSMIAAFPNSSSDLQPVLTKLQNDLSQLQAGVSNTSDFSKNYASDMRSIVGTVNSWKVGGTNRMSLDERAVLVTSYRQLLANYTQCEQQSYLNITQERLNEYQVQMNNFQNQANALAAKGFNTSSLNQLLQNAQNQIVVPLQNALGNATTAQDIQTAVRSYCLFDGCVNGMNFHLDAKFNVVRLNIVLTDLQTNAAAFNFDNAMLSQAQQYLTDAQNVLNSVGTSVYQQGQAQQIFSDVQKASKIIIQLMNQALKQPIGGLK